MRVDRGAVTDRLQATFWPGAPVPSRRCPPTARGLATALDLPLADLSAQLRPLLAAGTITRTGHARSTRYEA